MEHPGFAECVADWVARGIAAEWSPRVVRFAGGRTEVVKRATRYTGVPGMSAIANDLAKGLSIRTNDRVIGVDRGVSGWVLTTEGRDPHGPFGELIIALPAPQTAELLRGHSFSDEARAVPMVPCWCVMVAFQQRIRVGWDAAMVTDALLTWVARDSSRPGRDQEPDCWILHAGPSWSSQHLEATPDWVTDQMLNAFAEMAGGILPDFAFSSAHRWRYGLPAESPSKLALRDAEAGLTVCGDWLVRGSIEGAYLSGVRAAELFLSGKASVQNETETQVAKWSPPPEADR